MQMLKPEELEQRVRDLWNAMDTNGDSVVTKDEFINVTAMKAHCGSPN